MKQHPYYPVDLQLPNYVPNDRSILELLGVFFGFTGCSLVVLWLIISGLPHMKNKMLLKLKVCWFFVCGLIHLVLEGYFGLFNRTIPEGKSFLAELCEFLFSWNILYSCYFLLPLYEHTHAHLLTTFQVNLGFSLQLESAKFLWPNVLMPTRGLILSSVTVCILLGLC